MELREYPALGARIWYGRLPGGLPLYVLERPDSGVQFACLAVPHGGSTVAIPDGQGGWEPVPAGTAHYLEHKMFDAEGGGSVSERFGASGASDNAFTAETVTAYYFTCTSDFEKNLSILLDMVFHPHFTPESVEKERGIIGQEIRMVEDDPYDEAYCRMLEMMYAADPIRTRVVGSAASIADITAPLLRRFHAACCRPEDMVLTVSGALDPTRVRELAAAALAKVPAAVPAWTPPAVDEPAACPCREQVAEMEVAVPTFFLGIKGDAAPKGARLRQEMLARLASDALAGPSSALYGRLYDAGLINGDFSGSYDAAGGSAARLVYSGESRDPRRVRDELLREAARLASEGIDPDLWQRLTRAAYGGRVQGLNSARSLCFDLIAAHFDGEDCMTFPALYDTLRREDAEALLGSWCVPERTALFVAVPPDESKE